jgi:hypothetical protein
MKMACAIFMNAYAGVLKRIIKFLTFSPFLTGELRPDGEEASLVTINEPPQRIRDI